MTRDEIINFWGRDNLQRWPEAFLGESRINPESKSFLKTVGLPLGVDWAFKFELPNNPDIHKNQYFQIGLSVIIPISLDLLHSCQVVYLTEDFYGSPNKVVNTNIDRFAECLVYYQKFRMTARALPENEPDRPAKRERLIEALENNLRNADSATFDTPFSQWWQVVEAARDGF